MTNILPSGIQDCRVAIVGLGLLGTSLAMALKGKVKSRMVWTRRAEIRSWSLIHDAGDITAETPDVLLKEADITILCLPVPQIIRFALEHKGEFRKGSVVTDIGSVKGVIQEALFPELAAEGVHFVGSHPMAGTEKSGPEAAFAELYANAEGFVTPVSDSNPQAVELTRKFWETIGMTVNFIDPEHHDIVVAHTSHISHLLAMSLTHAVLSSVDDAELRRRFTGCATGFRDTSRIASSSPKMWREIIQNNQLAVLKSMDSFEHYWKKLRQIIESGDFDQFEKEFAISKSLRDKWIEYKNKTRNCNW